MFQPDNLVTKQAADPHIDKTTLAVIDAATEIGLHESVTFLRKLLYADDDDIVDAAHEALGLLEGDEFDDAFD